MTLAPAPSQTFSPTRDAARLPRLLDHGDARLLELVPAADQVRVGREEPVAADRDLRSGEDLGVEADVHVVAERDVAVLAGQDRAAPEEDAGAQLDAAVRGALGVEHDEVVHHHVVAEMDLVRMAQDHAVSEGDVAAHRPEQPGIGDPAQDEAERPGHPRRGEHDRSRRGSRRARLRLPTTRSWYLERDEDFGVRGPIWIAMGWGSRKVVRFRRRTVSCAVFPGHARSLPSPASPAAWQREAGAAPVPAGRTRGHAGHRRADRRLRLEPRHAADAVAQSLSIRAARRARGRRLHLADHPVRVVSDGPHSAQLPHDRRPHQSHHAPRRAGAARSERLPHGARGHRGELHDPRRPGHERRGGHLPIRASRVLGARDRRGSGAALRQRDTARS